MQGAFCVQLKMQQISISLKFYSTASFTNPGFAAQQQLIDAFLTYFVFLPRDWKERISWTLLCFWFPHFLADEEPKFLWQEVSAELLCVYCRRTVYTQIPRWPAQPAGRGRLLYPALLLHHSTTKSKTLFTNCLTLAVATNTERVCGEVWHPQQQPQISLVSCRFGERCRGRCILSSLRNWANDSCTSAFLPAKPRLKYEACSRTNVRIIHFLKTVWRTAYQKSGIHIWIIIYSNSKLQGIFRILRNQLTAISPLSEGTHLKPADLRNSATTYYHQHLYYQQPIQSIPQLQTTSSSATALQEGFWFTQLSNIFTYSTCQCCQIEQ